MSFPWANNLSDLRSFLNDNATDKLKFMKACIGRRDGANRVFKTLEFRRLTNLQTTTQPGLGVYVDGTPVTVDSDNPDIGVFTLHAAPGNQQHVEASYYIQWFTDSELTQFIGNASQSLGLTSDPTQVPEGLQPAALNYAAAAGYMKIAAKMAEKLSSTYKAEDPSGAPEMTEVDTFRKLSESCAKQAKELRDSYWAKSGRQNAVAHSSISGSVREPGK